MGLKSLVVLGGSDEQNGDYSLLRRLSKGDRHRGKWSCTKDTKAGDELWFYISKPDSAIVAVGQAVNDATAGGYWDYETRVGEVRWIEPHIGLDELRRMFPKWEWLNYTRGKTYIDAAISRALWKRLRKPPAYRPEPTMLSQAGAGFGEPEQNRRVEQAAIRLTTKLYRVRGYSVKSVEAERLGYDLVATSGRSELHLEVKGVSGGLAEFILTRNEARAAREDPNYRVVVVLNALSRDSRSVEMTGKEFLKRYRLSPVAFRAIPNSSNCAV